MLYERYNKNYFYSFRTSFDDSQAPPFRIAFQLQTTYQKYVFQQFFCHACLIEKAFRLRRGQRLNASTGFLAIASVHSDNNYNFLSATVFFLNPSVENLVSSTSSFSSSFLRFKVSLLFDDLITGKRKDKRS